ncbi:MAG: hypothetical protein BWX49_00012 [Bacteroidetes bacterium ADurb.Bin008]|jgi:hypothetical protein|nr:MAG: hypothetical protein BWX49_00012 [Bacteroidetes bacterium ADurb.Bin008]
MCFWQSKYFERGFRMSGTATEIIANISTRIAARAMMQQFKDRPYKELRKDTV